MYSSRIMVSWMLWDNYGSAKLRAEYAKLISDILAFDLDKGMASCVSWTI